MRAFSFYFLQRARPPLPCSVCHTKTQIEFTEESYVFLARVLEEKKFKTIAKELGMGEKGVTTRFGHRCGDTLATRPSICRPSGFLSCRTISFAAGYRVPSEIAPFNQAFLHHIKSIHPWIK